MYASVFSLTSKRQVLKAEILSIIVSDRANTGNSTWPLVSGRAAESKLGQESRSKELRTPENKIEG